MIKYLSLRSLEGRTYPIKFTGSYKKGLSLIKDDVSKFVYPTDKCQ
jgi:hypothetical protein